MDRGALLDKRTTTVCKGLNLLQSGHLPTECCTTQDRRGLDWIRMYLVVVALSPLKAYTSDITCGISRLDTTSIKLSGLPMLNMVEYVEPKPLFASIWTRSGGLRWLAPGPWGWDSPDGRYAGLKEKRLPHPSNALSLLGDRGENLRSTTGDLGRRHRDVECDTEAREFLETPFSSLSRYLRVPT